MENHKTVYDYKTVRVKREAEAMLTDAYEALGWETTGTTMADATLNRVNVTFKRARRTAGRAALLRMQERMDGVLAEIQKLQDAKRRAGTPSAVLIGIAGTLTFGGGLSMVLRLPGTRFLIGGIPLCLAGAAVALAAYPLYRLIQKKRLAKLDPRLDDAFERLSALCEAAGKCSEEK